MTTSTTQLRINLTKAIGACIDNAGRLLEETYDLEFREPCATRYFLAIIAQEEAAKAFILYLIREGVAPFSPAVRRAIRDHACKHLVGMVMDYMIRHWDTLEELQASIACEYELGEGFPNDVGSAIDILCHEKIGRWTKSNWAWADDPEYDRAAVNLAEGKKDRLKQDALYVRIGSDGQVASTPAAVNDEQLREQLEVGRRYLSFARALDAHDGFGFDQRRFEKVVGAFELLFGTASVEAWEQRD